LADGLWSAACGCHANQGHGQVKEQRLLEAQFGGFLAQTLKGTYTDKAEILCLMSGLMGSQIPMAKLYKVT